MPAGREPRPDSVGDESLRLILQDLLCGHFGKSVQIARLRRRKSAYSSSFPIEELEVELASGRVIQMMFKDLGMRAPLSDARRVKPGFLIDPEREIEMYRHVLSPAAFGSALCYGTLIDGVKDRYWLFLEKIAGLELYQIGEFEAWRAAARWLAGFHGHFEGSTEKLPREIPLIHHDRGYYLTWMERACRLVARRGEATADQVEKLRRAYLDAIERLLQLPSTLVHGEFFPSNVMVQGSREAMRIRVLDWETAAVGPGIIDVAALVSGQWNGEQKTGLVEEYLSAVSPGPANQEKKEEFFRAVACGQLHLAMQWLGWSDGWTPPEEHRQDWLRIGLEIAGELENRL
jgi:hypothetical protein